MRYIQSNIVKDILDIANKATSNALQAVNTQLVIRNWLIGKRIDEEILTNRSNDYGKKLIKKLSNELYKCGHIKGFDSSSLYKYHKFYKLYKNLIKFEIRETVFPQSNLNNYCNNILPFTYYLLLISIENQDERKWYEKQAIENVWSFRDLKRNIKTNAYYRVMSNNTITSKRQIISLNHYEYLKSPYILEFLKINNKAKFSESQLEQALIDNLTKFLLELGNGYTFKARQYHLKSSDNNYYTDLVFYNTNLKRYLLIDLKVGKIKHKDIGQMLLYLNLFDKQNNIGESNKSIGMILSSDLNSDIVRYLMNRTKDNVVATKYLTYLPSKEEIRKEIEKIYKNI